MFCRVRLVMGRLCVYLCYRSEADCRRTRTMPLWRRRQRLVTKSALFKLVMRVILVTLFTPYESLEIVQHNILFIITT